MDASRDPVRQFELGAAPSGPFLSLPLLHLADRVCLRTKNGKDLYEPARVARRMEISDLFTGIRGGTGGLLLLPGPPCAATKEAYLDDSRKTGQCR